MSPRLKTLFILLNVGTLLWSCRAQQQRTESATITVQGSWLRQDGQFVGVSYEKCPGNVEYVRLSPVEQVPNGPSRPTPAQKICLEALRPGSKVEVKLTATVNRLTRLHSWNIREIGGCNVQGMDGGFFSGPDKKLCPWMSEDVKE